MILLKSLFENMNAIDFILLKVFSYGLLDTAVVRLIQALKRIKIWI